MKLRITDEINPILKPFCTLGLRLEASGSNQATTVCPLCGASKGHFYINRKNGLWDCKQCSPEKEGGNIEQFLSRYVRQLFAMTTDKDYARLVKATRLSAQVFKHWSIARDDEHDQFLLPVRKDNGSVYNLVRFNNFGKFAGGLWGLGTQLYGEYKAKKEGIKTIIIAEGHKDCWTLSWLYRNNSTVAVVGVPGAGSNLMEYAWLLRDKHIIFCYDHDTAGHNGTQKAAGSLSGIAKSVKVLEWPKSILFKEKHGYDATNFYNDIKKKCQFNFQRLNRLEKLFKPWNEIKWIDESETGPQFLLARRQLSDVKEEKVDWLWKYWLAKGFVNLIVSVPGLGKSTLIQKFIANITSEKEYLWPLSADKIPKGTTILWSAEEDIARTIKPRQRKFGGNDTKIEIPPDVEDKTTGEKVPFNILEHRHLLEKLIEKMQPNLQIVVFDPAVEYISTKTDINVEMQIREILRTLQDIAEKYQIAIVAIAHINKNSAQYFLQRILGAQAWGARVRIVLGIAPHPEYPDDNTRRVLVHCKSALGPEQPAIGFQIVEDTDGLAKLTFDRVPVNLIKSDIFTPAQQNKSVGRPARAIERAKEFLKKILADGPVPPKIIIEFGGKQDITESTIKRATKELEIKTKYMKKGQYKGRDCWVLKSEKNHSLKVKTKKRKN